MSADGHRFKSGYQKNAFILLYRFEVGEIVFFIVLSLKYVHGLRFILREI